MPIKNYTTKVSAEKSVALIHQKLARAGAASISTEYDPKGKPAAISFGLTLDGALQYFRLPRNAEGAMQALKRIPRAQVTMERAEQVSWKLMVDWVDVQLALVEMNQAATAQVFFAYAIAEPRSYVTAYDTYRANRQKQLGSGGGNA